MTRRWLVLVAALVVVVLGQALPVRAATSSGTVVLMQPTFTGKLVTDSEGVGDEPYWVVHFTLPWTVRTPSPVCAESITVEDYATETIAPDRPGAGPEDSPGETFPLATSTRSYADAIDFGDYERGRYTAYVTVQECNGVSVVSDTVHLTINDLGDEDPQVRYGAGWSVATCSCFTHGSDHFATAKGASLTFRSTAPYEGAGVRLALIMSEAPDRGSAAVYVDGVKTGVVDTYSAKAVNGQYVYQLTLKGTGSHLIKIVDLGTTGHSRIDLDEILNGGTLVD